MQLGDRLATGLRQRRAELGLTLREVAVEAGVSLPYVANLEKGRGNPTLDVVEALAAALEITVAQLLSDEVSERRNDPSGALPPAAVRYARTEHFRDLTAVLARRQRIPVEETRRQVLGAMAAAPHVRGRPLTREDCRRLMDAFTLIIDSPQERA